MVQMTETFPLIHLWLRMPSRPWDQGKLCPELSSIAASILPQVTCVAVTVVMHLLFLVAFSWMLAEGLLLWSKVVAVSMHPGPRMRLYYAAGWGEDP